MVSYFGDALLFLVISGLLVPLLHRLRINPILGFLIMGLLVGPYGIAQFASEVPWLSALLISEMDHAVGSNQ